MRGSESVRRPTQGHLTTNVGPGRQVQRLLEQSRRHRAGAEMRRGGPRDAPAAAGATWEEQMGMFLWPCELQLLVEFSPYRHPRHRVSRALRR